MAEGVAHAVVVMGVSGCGKSTIATELAEALHRRYVDADDLHSRAAIAKMSAGIPLTDEDRAPWLERVGDAIAAGEESGCRTVVACSALRRRYRDAIRGRAGVPVFFVHLGGTDEVLVERMNSRPGHFMPPSLLASQLATLDPLDSDELGVVVDINAPVAAISTAALNAIRRVPQ